MWSRLCRGSRVRSSRRSVRGHRNLGTGSAHLLPEHARQPEESNRLEWRNMLEADQQAERNRRQQFRQEAPAKVRQPAGRQGPAHAEVEEQHGANAGVGPCRPGDDAGWRRVAVVIDEDQAEHGHDQPEDDRFPHLHEAPAEQTFAGIQPQFDRCRSSDAGRF